MSSVKDWTASVIKQAEIDKYLDGGKDFIDEEQIFADIENNKESVKRYYPFTCLRINSEDQAAMIRAMALNDDFFSLARQ